MNRKEKVALLKAQLLKGLEILEKTKTILDISFLKCKQISLVKELSENDLESFEALTARFARFVDISSQKILKTIFLLLGENPVTIIDQATFAEKLKIIPNAEVLLELRELRNLIAHEYTEEDLRRLFKSVLRKRKSLDALFKAIVVFAKELVATIS